MSYTLHKLKAIVEYPPQENRSRLFMYDNGDLHYERFGTTLYAQPETVAKPLSPRGLFLPRVSRIDPSRYGGDCWAIDGRSSERYTAKTWRMCVHYVLALVFG